MNETAIFAAGCFWGVEEAFRRMEGVVSTEAGYTGGHTPDPTYEDVCTGATGHAEAVRVVFDPRVIGYGGLLEAFWRMHDPTTPDRQGPDLGTQYRSAIFYLDERQRRAAEASRAREQASGRHRRPIVTEVTEATDFYRAEEYQKYHMRHGGPSCGLIR
ncbi:MAG: peptide-methionine (S)-S-oxide reductase MsrA [Thermoplasmata archaeon]|nr:peptide-methionine (S)-S-oxide reductase MsrA [Thermoplasmata archaeon]